jgi:hypothetical protein
VLKKDIRTKDKHKFSLPWDGPFILVDIAAPGAYVLPEVDGALLPNTWNADQWCKYYAWCICVSNKDTLFFILYLSMHFIIFRLINQRGLIDPTAKTISLEKEMMHSRFGQTLYPS